MGNERSFAKVRELKSEATDPRITSISDCKMRAFGSVKLLEVKDYHRTIVAIPCSRSPNSNTSIHTCNEPINLLNIIHPHLRILTNSSIILSLKSIFNYVCLSTHQQTYRDDPTNQANSLIFPSHFLNFLAYLIVNSLELKHPNLCNALACDSHEPETSPHVIPTKPAIWYFDYNGVSLDQVLGSRSQQNLRFPEGDLLRIASEVLSCLWYLYSQHKIGLGCLESSNLFLDSTENCIKLYDTHLIHGENFIYNRLLSMKSYSSTFVSTPESMYACKFNDTSILNTFKHESDIFSLGLTLLELATFQDSAELCDNRNKKILTSEIDARVQSLHPLYSRNLQKLIHDMLIIDPRERPSANRLLETISTIHLTTAAAATPKTASGSNKPFMPKLPIAEKITARNITFADLSPCSKSSSGRYALPSKSLSPTRNKTFAVQQDGMMASSTVSSTITPRAQCTNTFLQNSSKNRFNLANHNTPTPTPPSFKLIDFKIESALTNRSTTTGTASASESLHKNSIVEGSNDKNQISSHRDKEGTINKWNINLKSASTGFLNTSNTSSNITPIRFGKHAQAHAPAPSPSSNSSHPATKSLLEQQSNSTSSLRTPKISPTRIQPAQLKRQPILQLSQMFDTSLTKRTTTTTTTSNIQQQMNSTKNEWGFSSHLQSKGASCHIQSDTTQNQTGLTLLREPEKGSFLITDRRNSQLPMNGSTSNIGAALNNNCAPFNKKESSSPLSKPSILQSFLGQSKTQQQQQSQNITSFLPAKSNSFFIQSRVATPPATPACFNSMSSSPIQSAAKDQSSVLSFPSKKPNLTIIEGFEKNRMPNIITPRTTQQQSGEQSNKSQTINWSESHVSVSPNQTSKLTDSRKTGGYALNNNVSATTITSATVQNRSTHSITPTKRMSILPQSTGYSSRDLLQQQQQKQSSTQNSNQHSPSNLILNEKVPNMNGSQQSQLLRKESSLSSLLKDTFGKALNSSTSTKSNYYLQFPSQSQATSSRVGAATPSCSAAGTNTLLQESSMNMSRQSYFAAPNLIKGNNSIGNNNNNTSNLSSIHAGTENVLSESLSSSSSSSYNLLMQQAASKQSAHFSVKCVDKKDHFSKAASIVALSQKKNLVADKDQKSTHAHVDYYFPQKSQAIEQQVSLQLAEPTNKLAKQQTNQSFLNTKSILLR